MKQEKLDRLFEAVEEFIAGCQMKSNHRIFFKDIVEAFPDIKKKHLKKIWEDMQ